ncbi:TetR/AcrR family transcriptional regulator [Vallicoccus soli]|uniref:TetR/AcrR family transcriptional regulator n=1 Tax=Vallicoccus soli TaxID=2339232 RepID=A0A3A3Z0E9_9ACTN|nr:TetR/AcrR family transcriptional regulator [Vallicoccus soli]
MAQAGAELADEQGFDALTPSALARRLGVTVPALYAHVPGARGLRVRVALLALEELAERSGAALAGRSGADALRALGDVHRDYAREHPGRWVAAALRLDPEEAASSAGPRLAGLMRAAVRGYALTGEEEVHAVRLVGSTLRGFVDLEAAGGFDHSDPPPAASWDRALAALDAALSGWPATRTHDHEAPR